MAYWISDQKIYATNWRRNIYIILLVYGIVLGKANALVMWCKEKQNLISSQVRYLPRLELSDGHLFDANKTDICFTSVI